MDEHNFQKFQLFLINLYVKILKTFGSKKTANELVLDYIDNYSELMRKINDIIKNDINKIQKLLRKWVKLKR